MNTEKPIPDAETRAKSVARLKEIGLMFDHVNRILDEAIASAEIDLLNTQKNRQNSNHQILN